MTAPMQGVRVLEVAIYAFVPSAAAILVDWGADVLKVEHPAMGDPGRSTAALISVTADPTTGSRACPDATASTGQS